LAQYSQHTPAQLLCRQLLCRHIATALLCLSLPVANITAFLDAPASVSSPKPRQQHMIVGTQMTRNPEKHQCFHLVPMPLSLRSYAISCASNAHFFGSAHIAAF